MISPSARKKAYRLRVKAAQEHARFLRHQWRTDPGTRLHMRRMVEWRKAAKAWNLQQRRVENRAELFAEFKRFWWQRA